MSTKIYFFFNIQSELRGKYGKYKINLQDTYIKPMEIVKKSCRKKQGQYGLVIYGLSSIHDAKIKNNIESLKTQQYYLTHEKSI